MEFKVIEVDESSLYELFKDMYFKPESFSKKDIISKLKIGSNRYHRLSKEVKEETGFFRKYNRGTDETIIISYDEFEKNKLSEKENYLSFKKDYLDVNIKKAYLLKKYNLKECAYRNYQRRVSLETGYKRCTGGKSLKKVGV